MKLSEIKYGRAYKYNGKWGIVGLWDEKLILYPAGTVNSPEYFAPGTNYNVEINEEVAEAITEEWGQPVGTKLISTNSPKAKEIALDAAIKILPLCTLNRDETTFPLLAESIYQWLIKSDYPKIESETVRINSATGKELWSSEK